MTSDEMKFFEDLFRSLEREVHQVKDSVDSGVVTAYDADNRQIELYLRSKGNL
jgi:hypothetical protein